MSVLLEYLDLTLDTRNSVSFHNSLVKFLSTTIRALYVDYCNYRYKTQLVSKLHDRLAIMQLLTECRLSYLCGLYPSSFQTTKRHSYDGYFIYIPTFNQFFQAVTLQALPFFTQVISDNCTIHQIPPLVLRCALMSPLCTSSFSLIAIYIMCLHFVTKFVIQ